MIEIRRHDGGFSIFGHAGYAEPGKDIVCAAVSALTQAFIASVEELTQDKIKYNISAGNAVIRYENLLERGRATQNGKVR
ncbi:MAG: ribosomal-processing cysteine protease Prp [Christensenellaceae bacterium]